MFSRLIIILGVLELRCLKAVLTDDCSASVSSAQQPVHAVKFGRLCDLFGPLTMGPEILVNIKELMQEPWFHGEVASLAEASGRVIVSNSFLIRFSLTYRDRFTITVSAYFSIPFGIRLFAHCC